MIYWLASPSSRLAVVLGIFVLGLALVVVHTPEGLAAKDSVASKKERDTKRSVAKIDKEKLLYEGKSFEQWRELMFTDLSPKVRIVALKAMGAFGRKGYGSEAAAAIVKLMGDREPEEDNDIPEEKVVEAAVSALVKIGPAALPLLRRGLQNTNSKVRLFAITALPGFEDEAKPAIPALLQAIKTGDVKARLAAIGAVGSINREDRRFISALIDGLKDHETEIRREAARCLWFLGIGVRE